MMSWQPWSLGVMLGWDRSCLARAMGVVVFLNDGLANGFQAAYRGTRQPENDLTRLARRKRV